MITNTIQVEEPIFKLQQVIPKYIPSNNCDGYEPRLNKIKMTRDNLKDKFNEDKNIYPYIWQKNSSASVCFGELVFLEFINLLNNPGLTLIEAGHELTCICGPKVNDAYIYKLIHGIINDYNNFYLNDDYYYNGYWCNEEWYSSDDA